MSARDVGVRAQAVVCAFALSMGLGCSGKGDGSSPHVKPQEPVERDRPNNGVIVVDEQALRGSVGAGQIDVDVPIRVLSTVDGAEGTLEVSLRSVDGTKTLQTARVDYDLPPGKRDLLRARLALPDGVADQADLVDFNLRVEQTDDRPLRVTRSLMHVLPPYDMRLEGPAKLKVDKAVKYRALMQDPRTREPRADQKVELLVSKDGEVVHLLDATTDDTGSAVFDVLVEEPGDYEVGARVASNGTSTSLEQGIAVEQPGQKVLLTTDKPIYQPGQTIHLRALALQNPSNAPIARAPIVFEIEDGKGNKIGKRTIKTDDHGIASTRFAIAPVVNMGTFKLHAIAGAFKGEKTVEVSRYVLPKFDVRLEADRPFYTPGATLQGRLEARYFFGKDVGNAEVAIEAATLDAGSNVFQRVMGRTDAAGELAFSIALPQTLVGIPLQDGNALVTLRATVKDTAGQEVVREKAITVAASAVRLALVPESTVLVPGIENRVHLFATDPLGGPIVGAAVEVTPQGERAVTGETDPYGHAELRWTPGAAQSVHVAVEPEEGERVEETFTFGAQPGAQHVLVRTDKSIYQLGEVVTVHLFSSAADSTVYVDWLNGGQAVDLRAVELEDGRATFTMTVDESLLGDNRIEAYVVDAQGNVVRAGRSIVAKSDGALSVSLATDKDVYAPGEPAQLTFSVVDDRGEPAVAALGVQIVDEAVFSLIDARPGLLKTFFELEDAFATPSYEIKGPVTSFERLLFEETAAGAEPAVRDAAQRRAEGSLAALAARGMMGVQQSSWPKTVQRAHERLTKPMKAERERLIAQLKPIAQAALRALIDAGCKPSEYYCAVKGTSLFQALVEALDGKLVATDLWGSAYQDARMGGQQAARVLSPGPDEIANTPDDEIVAIEIHELGLSVSGGGSLDAGAAGCVVCGPNNWGAPGLPGAPNAGGAAGAGAAPVPGANPDPSDERGDEEAGPRVRSEFPETLYVNPSIITGADGKATLSVDMADSITEWRVAALANATSGKLGGGQAGIRVFQDFFADVNFPAELTRGDEVEFPVVVYNYLGEAQSVRLELEAASWYAPLGSTELMLELGPGEVRAARFPVRVEQVGHKTLTVRAFGDDASDAVARAVRVVPDGQAVPLAQSGSLAEGSAELAARFPGDAVAGSQLLYLDVYPAFLSQAVSGLDSMLQVPSGCFEQTTSTTWPNVLVTRYMEQTGQITPEIQLKAESLISAGYQRLLTFEHPGGGFSWFGTQDPAPYLSVTAFGLMEFADMAKVATVDEAMIARTQEWLVGQQAADGSWEGDMSEFFSFHTSKVRNTAFVLWALGQNGYRGPAATRAIAYLKANLAADESDAYTLALVANAFALAAPNDAFGSALLDKLDAMKKVDGDKASWDSGDTQTQFYSGGNDAAIASTALVVHAMLEAGGYAATVNAALNYLTASKDAGGNFSSTQSTVWTLKTLLLAALHGTEGAVGTLDVLLDGEEFASVELTEDQADVMTRVDMSALATTGDHAVTLIFSGEGKVSYNLVSQHHVPWASGQPSEGPLAIEVAYDRTQLAVDETVTATATIANRTAGAQSMILATLGLPPGFDLLTEDLDRYVADQSLSHYERTGKQLILYLTRLAPNAEVAFEYRLRATMPVRAADGGAEARLYYEPEKRAQSAAMMLIAND